MEAAAVSYPKALKIRLSLKGRPIKTYVFNQDFVLVGRNPDAEVFLDNPGISRDHLKIERVPSGYFVEDLNSANGTFVNDQRIQKQYLVNEDVIRIGKFSLWVSIEEDRRAHGSHQIHLSADSVAGTTVLRTSELQEMLSLARQSEPAPPPEVPDTPAPAGGETLRHRLLIATAILLAFLAGAAAGAGGLWWYLTRWA